MAAAPIALASPLPPADLRFAAMRSNEALSTLGEIELSLLSEKADLKPADLLGKPVTVTVNQRDDARRHFNGFVTRFGFGTRQGRFFGYRATVSPWLWFLTRTTDCRIFQDASVPDIVKTVFDDHPGIARFEFKLFRSYRKWIYCVQYRESDYNFVARLLEHEGIYWYVEHGDGEHTLVLVDSQSAHDAAPQCETLPFIEEGARTSPDTDCVYDWNYAQEVRSGKFALTSYDFERPATSLAVAAEQLRDHALAELEMFDWQGDYLKKPDGTQLVEGLRDEVQTPWESFRASSNAQGLEPGRLVTIDRHPRADFNGKYLLTGVSHHAWVDGHESGNDAGGYACEFSAIRADQQYRPPRRTPKPFVQGPQTAVVVGPAGEEIFTDKYGRVKVHFHWDRYSQRDERSSCWIRVSHPWAGKGWGGVSIPRIGQEVVVDFLEGDPDQPIITGRVYNAQCMPPYGLPGGAVVSGVKSQTHKGTGYNELSMDDTAGKEKITIHGQYDMASTIEHDQTTTVRNNRTDQVDVDDSETVGNNQTQTIGVNQTISVGSNQDISVGANRSKAVGADETLSVGANQTESIGASRTLTIGSADSQSIGSTQTVTVALAKAETIGAAYALTVGAAMNHAVAGALLQEVGAAKVVGVGGISVEKVGASKSISAGTNMAFQAAAKIAHKAGASFAGEAGSTMSFKSGADYSVNSSAKVAIEAASELVLRCGGAELVLKSSGDIMLKGNGITVKGSGKISVDASGNLDLKGSKINQNS